MENETIKKRPNLPYRTAILHSGGVVVYVCLVALLMNNGNALFGKEDTIFTIMLVLLLFTLSAAVVGSLIFAKPVLLAIRGSRHEAIQLVVLTLACLFVELLVFIILFALLHE